MAERLRLARERSKQRKELLKHTLGVEDLGAALGTKTSESKPAPSNSSVPSKTDLKQTTPTTSSRAISKFGSRTDLSFGHATSSDDVAGGKRPKCDLPSSDKNEEEFTDSTAFLKGTQSLNPHNDYSQNFVDTGQRPQNFIRDVGLADRWFIMTIIMTYSFTKKVAECVQLPKWRPSSSVI